MNSPQQITQLAFARLREAEILFRADCFDGAFYLAGYSVELMLKSRICLRLGVPNLFDAQHLEMNRIASIGTLRKTLKTHDLNFLLLLSGLKVKFDRAKARRQDFAIINSLLFTNWDENCRYKPIGTVSKETIEALVGFLQEENGLLQWISNN